MRDAVFAGFIKVIILTLLVCGVVFFYITGRYMQSGMESNMMDSVKLINYILDYDKELEPQINKINPLVIDSTSRITIISSNGTVLADTSKQIDFNDNHSDRKEVIDAMKTGTGINVRYSTTLRKNLMYVAVYSEKGDCIVRLAVPYNGLSYYARAIVFAIALCIFAAFIIASILAKRLSKSITDPLAEISNELLKIQNNGQLISFQKYGYDEINNIVKSTEILSARIDVQMGLLKEEKRKLDSILYNMNEGLILLDSKEQVIIINKAAGKIINCENMEPGKNILHYTQNLMISDAVTKAIRTAEPSSFDIEVDGKIYMVHVTECNKGAIVLFMDVTYERESQTIRQNFFSDASHELKTPITSINGYAELLTSGISYSDEQKTEFLNRIKTEANNMTVLINDILMISRMEAGSDGHDNKNIANINMSGIIEEVLEAVEPMLVENNIEVETDIDDTVVKADYNHMYNLVNNLVVNAIKYNNPNGKVYITSKRENERYIFAVKDTGIGIPAEYQNRVFERFFRVDKGRSKKVGGTGLGLAIVKHIVSYYNGQIRLKSKIDEGTEITTELRL